MELSKRLQAVADLVDDGLIVADIGTDHGYIPIYLVKEQKCRKAFAMDVNEGPLLRAKEHIAEHGLSHLIEVRQSDGVKALAPGEAECVVVAGMGGALTIKIMEEGKEIFRDLKAFVLQPQSELEKVRQYLYENNYHVVREDIVLEDGKFYPMMKVVNGQTSEYDSKELRYGKELLRQKHPVLKQLLEKEQQTKETILSHLNPDSGEHVQNRIDELKREIAVVKEALEVY